MRSTFDEDKDMLEAQQSVLGTSDRDPMYKIAVKADAGATQGRRLLEGMIKAEAEQGSAAA